MCISPIPVDPREITVAAALRFLAVRRLKATGASPITSPVAFAVAPREACRSIRMSEKISSTPGSPLQGHIPQANPLVFLACHRHSTTRTRRREATHHVPPSRRRLRRHMQTLRTRQNGHTCKPGDQTQTSTRTVGSVSTPQVATAQYGRQTAVLRLLCLT